MFLEKKPAVFRRTFEVPGAWLADGGKVWLYVWDLNAGPHLKEKITGSLNGTVIGEDLTRHATSHWCAFETGGMLRAGANTVAIRVPQGFLGYHVYLSKHAPVQYPALPAGENERWVDFADWRQQTRLDAARRGIEAIRSVDPLVMTANANGQPAVRGIRLEPLETKIFVTPRGQIASAPMRWFELQRNWWRGAKALPRAEASELAGQPAEAKTGEQASVDLTQRWRYQVLEEGDTHDPAPLAAPGFDDAAWPVRRLDCWAVMEELPSRRAFFRKTFRVPETWRDGEVELWQKAWFAWIVAGKARYWLDGRYVRRHHHALGDTTFLNITPWLKPGEANRIAILAGGKGEIKEMALWVY